ncbi:MAG: hypothetical protein KDK91_15555 [Gammaproteobacteria bacterium]|nr:hypothetical protein [Gammaproteobacteria bacterium]
MTLVLFFLTLMMLWRFAQANGMPGGLFVVLGGVFYAICSLVLKAHPLDAGAAAVLLDAGLVLLIVLTGHHWLPAPVATLLYDSEAHTARGARSLCELGYWLRTLLTRRPAIWVDEDLGHPGLKLVKSAVLRGDFIEARRILAMSSHDERLFLVRRLAATEGRATFIDEWLMSMPGCGYAHLVDGANCIHLGWRARGKGTADTVSARHASIYIQHLLNAQDALERAVLFNPQDSAPLVLLLETAKGLGERHQLKTLFERARTLEPRGFFAHCAMLEAQCERWGGSHGSMFELVERCIADLPDAHALHALPVIAHIEAWTDTRLDYPSRAIGTEEYFGNPSVRDCIQHAWQRFQGQKSTADTSENDDRAGAAATTIDPATLVARNAFAFAFLATGQRRLAASLLRDLGNRVCEDYWQHLAQPLEHPLLRTTALSHVYSHVWRQVGLAPEALMPVPTVADPPWQDR